ncbi:hypothetical protein BDQ17DRAFT_1385231 [Cyathus striatus]|nr:hypothetical protein BDQ17DRAFT_1385231 [Cyathus striatus]
MEIDTRPLAEVKTSTMKVKECPILTAGHINPVVFYSWSIACRRFAKHAEKKPSEIVSFIAGAMLEPRLVAWYNSDTTCIDTLTLEAYLLELSKLVLLKNWGKKIHNQILSSTQGSKSFMDWKIKLENLNAILISTSPAHTVDRLSALKNHLEANMDADLKLAIEDEELLSQEVAEWDEKLRSERICMQRLIDQAQSARSSAHRTEKRDLLSRLLDPPARPIPTTTTTHHVDKPFLPKLTELDKKLLNQHEGCARCRKFYAGHCSDTCPMKKTNSWPDAASYVPLMEAMARAAVPRIVVGATQISSSFEDEDTDFDLLVNELGLCRRLLPATEDNLSSLSQQPLQCLEYVKITLMSGNGMWRSGSVRAKVNNGLPVPLILGMPFLSAEHIVIDANARMAIDKRVEYDIVNPPPPPPRTWQLEKVTPPPTPKKAQSPL